MTLRFSNVPLNPVFADNVFQITGSSDATKIAAFEVDGFTTGTTRTFTLPNVTSTLAVLGLAQTFSATQTFAGIDATSIGATTPGSGDFTTLTSSLGLSVTSQGASIVGGLQVSGVTSASSVSTAGGYTSTVATGTAPFTATSTTACPNLNASLLLGSTWAAPGTIGSGTPSTGAFTTLGASGVVSFTNTTEATGSGTAGVVLSCGLGIAKTTYLASDGDGGSQQIKSGFGNIVRHRRYGYSNAYTAVQVGDPARGVGFGIDPNSVAGGQFTGDSTDFFFSRNAALGCPNAGATDWEWALKIAGGSSAKSAPMVEINGTGLAMSAGSLLATAAGTTSVASLRIPHGAAPSSPTNGDMWTTTAGLFVRINGVTKTVTLT